MLIDVHSLPGALTAHSIKFFSVVLLNTMSCKVYLLGCAYK